MVVRFLSWFAVGVLGVSLVGCSSDGAEPVARADFPAKYAQAICDSVAGCCSKSSFNFDATNCVATETARATTLSGSFDQAKVNFNEQAAGDCLAAMPGRLQCGDTRLLGSIKACTEIFTGKLPLGASCSGNGRECSWQENSYCAASPQDPTGVSKVCTAFTPSPHGTVNEACSFSCEGSVCWDPEAVG
ncbi:MAG TPA: hypothetical protein VJV79_10825, partial [Polyangiaceae bacterium]|nr:hypothetical protein [Polyangiaceae bacterium]